MNSAKIYIPLIILLIAILIIFEIFRPKPIDWSYNFLAESKKPNGCYIYFNLLNRLLPNQTISENETNVYDFLHHNQVKDNSAIIFITDYFDADTVEMSLLLNKVSKGSSLFISAFGFNKYLVDTLNFQTAIPGLGGMAGNADFHLKNPRINRKGGFSYKNIVDGYFKSIDSSKTIILGTNGDGKANFIAFSYGAGHIFLHLVPTVFSNYQLLYGNKDYPMALSAYFQNPVIYWDNYLKPGNLFRYGAPSPLRYILSNESLKLAYILVLITLALLIIFGSKRKQRIIPIIRPPVNSSLEFVELIASLYMNSNDYKYLAGRKFAFFSEYIRSHFYMSVTEDNETFYRRLSEKSGVKYDLVKSIFVRNNAIREKNSISLEKMVEFIKTIDEFYNQSFAGHGKINFTE